MSPALFIAQVQGSQGWDNFICLRFFSDKMSSEGGKTSEQKSLRSFHRHGRGKAMTSPINKGETYYKSKEEKPEVNPGGALIFLQHPGCSTQENYDKNRQTLFHSLTLQNFFKSMVRSGGLPLSISPPDCFRLVLPLNPQLHSPSFSQLHPLVFGSYMLLLPYPCAPLLSLLHSPNYVC